MCILLTYAPANDEESDYSFILASNRDEFFGRPALNLSPWPDNPEIYGGRDMLPEREGGTWLAISKLRKKIGVLLNTPPKATEAPRGRGFIVSDFLKSELSTSDYVNQNRDCFKECHPFILVSIELGNIPVTQSFCSATDKLEIWPETTVGFGNSVPEKPLKKVVNAKNMMKDICMRLNKIGDKEQLIDELLKLLKSRERHLPDEELQKSKPTLYEKFSSIFVEIEGVGTKYGTRTHTIILVTKEGHVEMIEVTRQPPMEFSNPNWKRTEFQFDI